MASILTNATLFTSYGQEPIEEAMLVVNGGRFEYIGPSDHSIETQWASAGAQIRDMAGAMVGPSFIDSHMHLLLLGASLLKINLEHCKNLDDVRKTIRAGAAERPDASRLYCKGWMRYMSPDEPTAAMLDDIDPRPIYITSRDLHDAWCNTAALRELDIQDTPDPAGGRIFRDSAGNPAGVLSEAAAITIVWPYMNSVTSIEEKMHQSRAAIAAHSAHGYTGIVDLATDEEIWGCMLQLHQEGLPIRMAAHWLVAPSADVKACIAQVDRAIELHKQYNLTTSPDCRIAGIKLLLDGVVDACTAALSKPYTSNNSHCDPIWNPDDLAAVVKHADAAGLQCALHAIGDRAVTLAVDTLAAHGSTGRRHRIEHLELTSPADAARLGALGITASIQPVHADPSILRAWPDIIGPDRCTRAFAYSDFHDGGASLAVGTDAPTAPTDPLHNLYVATTRKSAREPHAIDLNPVNPNFALPLAAAFQAATEGAARSCFAEGRVGSLEVGKLADFVVLGLKEWHCGELLQGEVRETWFGGKRVFKKA